MISAAGAWLNQRSTAPPALLPTCLQYEVKVVGVLPGGKQVPGKNILYFTTPKPG